MTTTDHSVLQAVDAWSLQQWQKHRTRKLNDSSSYHDYWL